MAEICADEENRVSSLLFESERNVFNAFLVLDEGKYVKFELKNKNLFHED